MREAVRTLSASLGRDRALVQGPGGNVSWKDERSLHVKASGMWLADALEREVFVSLPLEAVLAKLDRHQYDFSADGPPGQPLRPSIETAIHALLPHRVVVHIHPVDVIARSIRRDSHLDISDLMSGLNWAWIDYAKPSEALSRAIRNEAERLGTMPAIWILANHGLVVGAETAQQAGHLVHETVRRLAIAPRDGTFELELSRLMPWLRSGYRLPANPIVHALALDTRAVEIAEQHWVLYPDQAVFLGGAGLFAAPDEQPERLVGSDGSLVPVVIVRDTGVVIAEAAGPACEPMLICYAEVLMRLDTADGLVSLSAEQIDELLNWEAEAFRRATKRRTHPPFEAGAISRTSEEASS